MEKCRPNVAQRRPATKKPSPPKKVTKKSPYRKQGK